MLVYSWVMPSCRTISLSILFITTYTISANRTYAQQSGSQIAIAWNEGIPRQGKLRSFSNEAPWPFVSPTLDIGVNSILRVKNDLLYVVSKTAGTVSVFDPVNWTKLYEFSAGPACEPVDIAVITQEIAYVSCTNETHLRRFNPTTGESTAVLDLSSFADTDGIPDMNMMAVHDGRLFIQLRRLDSISPSPQFTQPAMLTVMDIASETLIDVDGETEGVQAIILQGMSPKLKMQIIDQTRQLFLSASGDFFDEGGIEMIDLDTLQSLDLVVAEVDNQVGADLGTFVLVRPERGYLAYSTDLAVSSHLNSFTVAGGADPSVGLDESVGYFSPTMVFDASNDTFIFPVGGINPPGVHILNADAGQFITDIVVSSEYSWVTDVVLIANGTETTSIPASSSWGLYILILLQVISGSIVLIRRTTQIRNA